jgi:hypothetical protein
MLSLLRAGVLAALTFAVFASLQARAADFSQPDLVSFGGGYFDFDKDESHKRSADFRLEYRWGLTLLPSSWGTAVQLHPFIGGEATSLGATYGLAGLAMDGYIGRHGILTWSEGVGFFGPGDMQSMGSYVEFRSELEAGYRFDNEMRVTASISHISNAGITQHNPGAEIAGMYFHVPVTMFCPNK